MTSTKKPAADNGFAALGLGDSIVTALTALGYEEPTPVQRETIPLMLAGRDVLAQAATGTGKTAAFALPMVERISADTKRRIAAMVLVPTRELAMQVAEAIHKYGRPFHTRVLPVYGGAAFGQQARSLERGVDVVVAGERGRGRALGDVEQPRERERTEPGDAVEPRP
jgi:ATP-dependent RNA helicase DeaD